MSPKKLGPPVILSTTEKTARILILPLIVVALIIVAYVLVSGHINPDRKQNIKTTTTPVPEPERTILPPRI